MSANLNKEEIIRFVRKWFALLNEHASIQEVRSMLSAQGLEKYRTVTWPLSGLWDVIRAMNSRESIVSSSSVSFP